MRFCHVLRRMALGAGLGAVIALAAMPSSTYAMVGDIPAMPPTEQTGGGSTSGGGSSVISQGVPPSGGPGPLTTSEPPALLSGLVGLGLLGAYQIRKNHIRGRLRAC